MDVDETLELLLFAEKKIVTAITLSRKCDIPTTEAVKKLNAFFECHQDTLNAVYTISGKMDRNGQCCYSMVLCKDKDLEDTKQNFLEVKSVTIFSLQSYDIEDVNAAIASDMLEDSDFFRSDASRAPFTSSKVLRYHQEMESSQAEELETINKQITEQKRSESNAIHSNKKTAVKTEKKADLKKLFENACNREKVTKSTPPKLPKSPFSTPNKKEASSPTDEESPENQPRKRKRKIFIDDEEASNSPKKVLEEKAPKKRESPQVEVKSKKPKLSPKLEENDIFDANASSPEKEENVDNTVEDQKTRTGKKRATKKELKVKDKETTPASQENKEAPLRRSPRKLAPLPPGKRKVMKKVEETFVDDEGFLVKKEVMREVSVEPEDDKTPSAPLASQVTNKLLTTKPAATKNKKSSQANILSFFKKA